ASRHWRPPRRPPRGLHSIGRARRANGSVARTAGIRIELRQNPVPSEFQIDHRKAAIVENEPATIETYCGHGVIVAGGALLHDEQLQVFRCYSGLLQGQQFEDRVVLAVSGPGAEGFEWSGPV